MKVRLLITYQLFLDLLSYLRAHCLPMYNGSDFQKIKMTEPTLIDFEIMILEQYLACVKLVLDARNKKGLRDVYDEQRDLRNIKPHEQSWREKFISTYRCNHAFILQDQVQLLNLMLIILRETEIYGLDKSKDVIRSHALMADQNLRLILHSRKYLKALFTANAF